MTVEGLRSRRSTTKGLRNQRSTKPQLMSRFIIWFLFLFLQDGERPIRAKMDSNAWVEPPFIRLKGWRAYARGSSTRCMQKELARSRLLSLRKAGLKLRRTKKLGTNHRRIWWIRMLRGCAQHRSSKAEDRLSLLSPDDANLTQSMWTDDPALKNGRFS
jgi:hypothetical protein